MNVWYHDHTGGKLSKLSQLLEAVVPNRIDGKLRSIPDDNLYCAVDIMDGDLLILHTKEPTSRIKWVQERVEISLVLVSRVPIEQLQGIFNDTDLHNCTYYHRSVRDGEINVSDFQEFLEDILKVLG